MQTPNPNSKIKKIETIFGQFSTIFKTSDQLGALFLNHFFMVIFEIIASKEVISKGVISEHKPQKCEHKGGSLLFIYFALSADALLTVS